MIGQKYGERYLTRFMLQRPQVTRQVIKVFADRGGLGFIRQTAARIVRRFLKESPHNHGGRVRQFGSGKRNGRRTVDDSITAVGAALRRPPKSDFARGSRVTTDSGLRPGRTPQRRPYNLPQTRR